MGRQEKVKFYMILYLLPCFVISPPEGSHLDGMVGVGNDMDLHLDTPQSPRVITWPWRGTGSRKVLVGFVIIGVGFVIIGVVLSLLGFSLYF